MRGTKRGQGPGHRLGAGGTAAVLIAALVAVSVLSAAERTAPVRAAGTSAKLLPLYAADGKGATIRDSAGRQVLLRGVNATELVDFYQVNPEIPTTVPLRESEFAQMSAFGFDVVRLGVSWSRLEPSPGEFNDAYLSRIVDAVRWAGDHGIYVVIDMHEDGWGKYVGTPPGATCPDGWRPRQGFDGAPEWATITDGYSTCRPPKVRNKRTPAERQAFRHFWLNTNGIRANLVATWAKLAGALSKKPAVAGYDLMNEPDPGNAGPPGQTTLLGRFYRHTIAAIREAESTAGGFQHIVFFEPSLLWWRGRPAKHSPPPGFSPDRNLVFAPHHYRGAIGRNFGLRRTRVQIGLESKRAARRARRYGVPVWIGEWGWFGDPRRDEAKIAAYAGGQDRRLWGGVWWQWNTACGNPGNFMGPHDKSPVRTSGNLIRRRCPSGRRLAIPGTTRRILARPYPRAAPGTLSRLRSDPGTARFVVAGFDRQPNSGSCKLQLWVPARGSRHPRISGTGFHRVRSERTRGGWIVTACVRGRYRVTGGYG